jgi:multidrug efflux system membrane fusion protein
VPVRATIPGDPGAAIEGAVAYVENAIDPASNTLSVKASFANAQRRLWPGQFINVTLVLALERDAVTVPAEAVQAGQAGAYLFVVKTDGAGGRTVEARTIEVDRRIDGEAIIAKGLAAGETVVINGQLRLENGTRVTVKPAAPAAAQAGSPS